MPIWGDCFDDGWERNRGRNKGPQAAKLQLVPNVEKLAGVTGLEPATSAVTGQRSEPIELHPRVCTAGKSTWASTAA